MGRQDAHFVGLGALGAGHEANRVALAELAVDNAYMTNHSPVEVVVGIEDEGPQRGRGLSGGWRQSSHDRFQQSVDSPAGLGRYGQHIVGRSPQNGRDLGRHPLGLGGGKVDLVDDRDDLQAGFDRQVGVGQRLRLHALAGVDEQDGSFAGFEAARHLVREVDMSGGVDEIQGIGLAVGALVAQPDRLRLDRDPPLTLDFHGVEHLLTHVSLGDRSGELQEAIGQRRLAVIDVGDDREVANARLGVHGNSGSRALYRWGDPCYRCADPPTRGRFTVANIRSQMKRNRQMVKRQARNKAVRSEAKTRARQALAAAEAGDAEAAQEALRRAQRTIDSAVSKGVFHRNTAARRKSRLSHRVRRLLGS